MYFCSLFSLVALIISVVDGANILAIMPTPSYSHHLVFKPLWKALSRRGHRITLLTTNPINDPKNYPNITEVDWSYAYELWNDKYEFTKKLQDYQSNFLDVANTFFDLFHEIMDAELSHPQVKKIIKNETFDLVMAEYLFPTMMAFSKWFDCPLIGVMSMETTLLAHEAIGNPTHPGLYPDCMQPYDGDVDFLQRLISTIHWTWVRWYATFVAYPRENMTIKKHFGDNMPHLADIEKNISMLFLNINPVFHTVRPLVPGTIAIGGGFHMEPKKPLPKDLQSYLDSSTQGVIYFSLGTNIKSKELPETIRQEILQTFVELPYNILWKYESNDLKDELPKNVMVRKWLPQQDVLRHRNIKLFITHGGLQSMEEAVINEVPMLAHPFFSDQLPNVKAMVSKGLGEAINFRELRKDTFKDAIMRVINNKTYKHNAQRYAALLTDHQISRLDLAVWWTEYVLRHKGAAHLRSPSADVPFYKFYLLDVIAALCLASVCIYYIVHGLVMLISKILKVLFADSKIKSD